MLIRKAIITFTLVSFFVVSSFSGKERKHCILVLHSHNQGYEWTDNLHDGIMSTLSQKENLEVYVEYMDKTRHAEPHYTDLLEALYFKKYTQKNRVFDGIIVADDDAFNFVLERRDLLFSGTPIVFVGVDDFSPERIKDVYDITGAKVSASIKETIDLAIDLFGNIEKMAVISGSRLTERIFLALFKEQSVPYTDLIDFVYLSELEPEDLNEKLKELGDNDVIFYLSYLLTPSGKTLTVNESLELITSASQSKIFSIRKYTIQKWALGGKVVNGVSHGLAAAQVTLDIINGRNINDIPVFAIDNVYMFNGFLLAKHGISEEQLPENSIIIRRTPEKLILDWDKIKNQEFFGYDLFENHGSVMLIIDPETGLILDANRAAYNYYGYPLLIGENIQEIHVLSWDEIKEVLKTPLNETNNYYQFQHRLATGDIRDVYAYAYTMKYGDMEVYFSIIADVTDKIIADKRTKTLNRIVLSASGFLALIIIAFIITIGKKNKKIINQKFKLENSERLFRLLAENAPVSIVMVDYNGNIIYANPAVTKTLGYTIDDVPTINQWWSLAYPDKDYREIVQTSWRENILDVKPDAETFATVDFLVNCKNNTKLWISFQTKKTIDKSIIVLTDITHFKKSEKELIDSNRSMEEIIYLASHDLQTPLVSMEGLSTELLQDYSNQLDEEGMHCLKRLNANTIRMHKLVKSLLNISRLTTGSVNPERFELNSVVNKITNDLSLHLENNDAQISTGDLPVIYADKQRVEMIMRNIIVNSINFKGKKIHISYNNNILSIEDDGIGIPPDQLERVFSPGERLNKVESDGIGMGLVFCRRAITQMNGKIWLESLGAGKGTTVKIQLSQETVIV